MLTKTSRRPTIAIFDGRCVICNTTRRLVTALDWFKRVQFIDLHDRSAVSAAAPTLDHATAMGEIHVIADNDQLYAGFQGTRRMLKDLPLGWPLWALLHLPVIGDWLGPRLYRFIARHRYRINRLLGVDLDAQAADADCEDVCKIP